MQVWKTIRIFISSTFRDMHAERDFLVRVVFPELRERCAKRNLHLIDVDLRWGVTEAEAKQGKVIEICFDEIERCRPFFIGLLGERYGWTPEKFEVSDDEKFDWLNEYQGHSVTALEIYHGVLRDDEMKTRAFFYFREADFLKDVPDENRADFLPESDDAVEKLRVLKEEIITKCPVFENYPCTYDGIDEKGKVKLADLEEFGKRVLEDLWTAICLEHPEDETPPDDLAIERSFHESFIENRTERFIGRRDVLDKLNEFADGEDENSLVVTGAAGCGKSAVLAKFAKDYAEKHAEDFVLTHFIGVSPGSTDVRRTLLRLCRELKRKFDIQEEIPTDYYELRQVFVKFLEQAAEQGKVLLVIDALNQLDESHFAHHLDWLPQDLPKNTKLIVSTLEGDCLDALRRRSPTPREVVVGALAEEERKEIVRQTLETYRKTLDENQMRLLLAKKESDNPLFLIVACEEMRVYGDFESVSDKLESLAEQVETLFGQVLERVEHDHGTELVTDALVLLECSRHGLLESEMLELLARDSEKQLPQAVWARFYRSIQFYLRPPGESGEGLLDFFHRQLSKAVRNRYLTDEETEIAAHQRLARYFQRKADSSNDKTWTGNYPRGLSELAHHQLAGKLYDDLFQIARDETFLTKQAENFPDDPELQLQTLQNAITGAAEIDDAAKMAEFVLLHAQRIQSMSEESPLEALRKGNLERAWKLADLYEIERCILWYLLIAWELKDCGQIENARETLERLQKKSLPRLSGWESAYAFNLLLYTFEIVKQLKDGYSSLLGFEDDKKVALGLIKVGMFTEGLRVGRKIQNAWDRAMVLQEAGLAQAKTSDIKSAQERFLEAIETSRSIGDGFSTVDALRWIALAQFQVEGKQSAQKTFIEAIETAQQIKDEHRKMSALWFISVAQARIGDFTSAIETAKQINQGLDKDTILSKIVEAQSYELKTSEALLTASQIEDAQMMRDAIQLVSSRTIELDLESVQDKYKVLQVNSLCEVAKEQSKLGAAESAQMSFTEASEIAKTLNSEYQKVDVLRGIAIAQAQTGRTNSARETFYEAIETIQWMEIYGFDKEERLAQELSKIALAQAEVKDTYYARDTFAIAIGISDDQFDKEKNNALWNIALAKAQGGEFSLALEITRQIGDNVTLNNMLYAIGLIQVQNGEFSNALGTAYLIDGQFETTYQIYEGTGVQKEFLESIAENLKADIIQQVAIEQARKGLVSDALETIEYIKDDKRRANVLIDILLIQTQAVDDISIHESFTKAFQIVQGLDGEFAIRQIGKIAVAQAKINEMKSAHETLAMAFGMTQQIKEDLQRINAYRVIVFSHLQMAEFSMAIKIANQIADPNSRSEILFEIALSLSQSFEFSAARKLIQEIEDSKTISGIKYKALILRECALAKVKIKKVEDSKKTFLESLETARLIQDEISKANVLSEIAAAQVKVEDIDIAKKTFDEAIEVALSIEFDFQKANALRDIALTQAILGLTEESLNTSRKILTNRNKNLVAISDVFAQMKDKNSFKQLLPFCAYYLDASYCVCGQMAQLYPNQVNIIAHIVQG